MDPLFLAQSRYIRRHFDKTIALCNEILKNQPERAAFLLKVQALTEQTLIDDTEDLEEEGVAEIVMDENAIATIPRPGTSLKRPKTMIKEHNQNMQPNTSSGRPSTGFARTGTQKTAQTKGIEQAFAGGRSGTSRPISVAGRYVRIGTQAALAKGETDIVPENIDAQKYANRQPEAKAIVQFLLYHEQNARKAIQICSVATEKTGFNDWWWKARLGKCYYKLGMYREAEQQFKSALKQQEMISVYLELSKLYLRIDQPKNALENYSKASEKYVGDTSLIIGMARVYDMLSDTQKSVQFYKKALHYNASNVEAIACLASHHFYTDQPEIAMRFYRRLLQLGVQTTELWNNLGLCCFYSNQYDMTLNCFERALMLADESNTADVWYNIGQVAIGIGDMNLAYQSFKIAISADASHAESFNNLGILELRKGNLDQARSNFQMAQKLGPHAFEAFYNGALAALKIGDCEESFGLANKAIELYPEHTDSRELIKQLTKQFIAL